MPDARAAGNKLSASEYAVGQFRQHRKIEGCRVTDNAKTVSNSAYRRALELLWKRSSYERGYVTDPFGGPEAGRRGLRRVAALLERLGAPQHRYAIIHIAGSKGKGSTAAMTEAIVRAAGGRTGLFTSPHLHSFRERIAIDGEAMPEADFARLANRVEREARALEAAEPALGQISTFEFLAAMALLAFAEANVALAVLEVGLGGEFDATNTIDPLVSVITRIDLEHTAVLGDTVEQIAAAKAGIIKPSRPIVVASQPAGVLPVFEAAATQAGAPLLTGDRDWTAIGHWSGFDLTGPWGRYADLRLSLPGDHQLENAGAAVAAVWLANRAGFVIDEAAIRAGLAATRWPGRFERVAFGGRTVVLDGAHTPAAAAALALALAHAEPGRRAWIALGRSSDKNADVLVAALAPVAAGFIATRALSPRAGDPAPAARAAEARGLPAEVVEPVAAAVRRALAAAGDGGLVVVTGSLYVVGEAREALGLAQPDPPWGPPDGAVAKG
ncbi:MAG: bifunctional folylpolyglutamate synthase/dihydrofolate synthase [Thermomicrobiales bacterium]|nr:bifunctional folylpolyglutamate synthase/dihydrofolate synthase [Thermomicrobiales bacterium]